MIIKVMEVNEGAGSSKDCEHTSLVQGDDIIPGCSSFDDFSKTAYAFVMSGIKCSSVLPTGKEFSYYSTFPEIKNTLKEQEGELLQLMQKVLTYCGSKRSLDAQCVDDKFDLIIDINDILLERTSKNLRELDGIGRNPVALGDSFGEENTSKTISGSWNKNQLQNSSRRNEYNTPLQRADKQNTRKPIQKPQILFKEQIDNRNETWVPKIKEKPNALKPLSILLSRDEKDNECYTHPYEYELNLFKVSEDRLRPIDKPTPPKDLDNTPLIMVVEEKDVDALIDDLLQQKEIAVDLEHHSLRSFMGITCLLQISTREKDYIIDALSLRHVLYKLNEVFTKPTILKIFHSALSDIEWLQRDLGVYVVNMFDTYHAAKVLSYPKLGLSYLLKKFCNVTSNKRFQMYDWRIRPLSQAAMNYARIDTHYLIYIYEMMTNELTSQAPGLLPVVFQRSTDTCKRIYHKPILTEDSYMNLYRKSGRQFDSRQMYALKEIYKWRDQVAREEDESPGYILTNHMLMQICQTLPREMQGILACCNPVPPSVRQHLLTLHNIVLKAKEQPLVMPLIEESAKPSSEFSASRDFDLEAKLSTYIHDNAGLEIRDDYPTLLDNTHTMDTDNPKAIILTKTVPKDCSLLEDTKPKLRLMVNNNHEFINLDRNNNSNTINNVDEIANILGKVKFVTPYERYKQVLPYSRKLEEEEREKKRLEEEKNQERLLKTQYNIAGENNQEEMPAETEADDSQEKENILKRPHEVKTDPLSADCRHAPRYPLKVEQTSQNHNQKRRSHPSRTSFKKGSHTLYSIALFRGSLR
ncbi:hypothetical protein O3M35_001505 [Rhynocoris fuscipes]|uniref:Exosome complex component 10 homolog n=1 Tax=Rhynocoris fuscipes TaxID=488301 RepID=A0AAW1CP66_9HEMI